ncbi:sodium-dependent glucose transporter 1A-like isoform X2 [Argopecten irradians]|uniref:sodium-dependent glucose transporter 1A-like isoform X2 n=1 Tax=Argopecten irradians TaxID=31199 RepID=UPI003715215C
MACTQSPRWKGTDRRKIIHSMCIYMMFLILGWTSGLFGPSFVDLLLIADVSLKLGSWISALYFVGYAVGCVTGGVLYDRIDRNCLYAAGIFLVGILIAVIPCCFIFALMVLAHFLEGFSSGVVDTVGNAELINIWRENSMMFFMSELCYTVGLFLAPMVVAPFVSDDAIHQQLRNGTELNNDTLHPILSNITIPSNIALHGNLTRQNESHAFVSRLFIPYFISAALAILISLPFVIKFVLIYVKTQQRRGEITVASKESKEEDETKGRQLPTKLKFISLVLFNTMVFVGLLLCESSTSFIAVYTVEQMGFTPAKGALVNAVANVCGIVAILVAMFASSLNILVFLGIHTVGMLAGLVGLLFSSLAKTYIGIWFSSAVVGYFRSMIFSFIFTWTNNYITPTTGKVSSLFMMSSCTGAAVGPILLGWLMEEYTYLWFCYLLTIFGVVQLLLYIIGIVLTKYVTSVYGKTYKNVEDISLTEKLNKEESLDMK